MNNLNVKVRLQLKHKEEGYLQPLIGKLYDESNGLLNFPVDFKQWELLGIERSSAVLDTKKFEIFENDKVTYLKKFGKVKDWCDSKVVFTNGSFQLEDGTLLTNEFVKETKLEVVQKL